MITSQASMQISVKRNFVNVGQALFAIEEHKGKTIVYDCGGESRLIVNAVLPYIFSKGSIIDILFISHYDNDHINGVQYLLHHCNVKHIVLPMIEEAFRMASLIKLYPNSFAYLFTTNPQAAVREEISIIRETRDRDVMFPAIHLVEAVERSFGDANLNEPIRIDEMQDGTTIPGNKSICIDANNEWIYLPFNRKVMTSEESESFMEFLELPKDATCDDLMQHWGLHWIDEVLYRKLSWFPFERRHPLKDAWHAATGISYRDINDHSMTLYSGPGKNVGGNGCLFTGDYNANKYMTELYQYYVQLWGNICVVQVPHHGSNSNFDDQLIISGATHVISNKEVPSRASDVKYCTVWDKIVAHGEHVVGTWQEPLV